jgi:membrane fusion protein, multidrug efflux system
LTVIMIKIKKIIQLSLQLFGSVTRRMRILILVLLIVFGGLIAFNLFRSYMTANFFSHFEPPAATVSSVIVKLENWQPVLQSVGDFVAIQGVEINAQVSGIVSSISFESGQFVKQGTPLLVISDSVDQATLKDNEANLILQRQNLTRQAGLKKSGWAISSDLDVARANLKSALAMLQKTQATIEQKHIVAPFDGQLGIRQVSLGDYITPGQTNIVSLQSLDPLYLQFYLPEQNLSTLFVGQPIQFSVESHPNQMFDGKITAIDSKVDVNTHNILVQATVNNLKEGDHYNFMPGMFAKVSVLLPQKEKVVVLPLPAVTYTLYGDSVYIVKNDEKNKAGKSIKTVYRQFVKAGEKKGDHVVILSGIKEGDEVVSAGQMKLHNGSQVVIDNTIVLDDNKSIIGQ